MTFVRVSDKIVLHDEWFVKTKQRRRFMKKIISTILVCVLLVGTVFTLASCGMISGTYKSGVTTLEFSGNKLKITESAEILGKVVSDEWECKYKIEETDDGRTITFTYEEDADEHHFLNGTLTFSDGEEDGTKYIKIGIITYEKQ